MNRSLVFLCLTALFLFPSCSSKVPNLSDPNKGIVALPLKIRNDTQFAEISHDYSLTTYFDEDEIILIEPRVGQNFAFSGELEPGEYELSKIISMFDLREAQAYSQKNKVSLNSNIKFTIEPGTISLANKIFTIHQFQRETNSYLTQYSVELLPKDERKKFIDQLKDYENIDQWDISE